jgi:hypothetical protein
MRSLKPNVSKHYRKSVSITAALYHISILVTNKATIALKAFVRRPDVLITFGFALLLIALYVQKVVSLPAELRTVDPLIEAILLLLALTFNAVIFLREWRLTNIEMCTRLRSLLEQLRESKLGQKQVIKSSKICCLLLESVSLGLLIIRSSLGFEDTNKYTIGVGCTSVTGGCNIMLSPQPFGRG